MVFVILLNDDEPDPPDWQLPGKPFIIRQLSWYLRNPLHNFGKYVLGVTDRNYTVVGAAPVYATSWSDVDPIKTGWKISTILSMGCAFPLFPMRTVCDLVRRLAMVGVFRV
jgi:hypothetical protein